jgi:hypothetical protein
LNSYIFRINELLILVAATIILSGCFVDRAASIESVVVNGTLLEIGIGSGMSNSEDCMLLESTRLLDKQAIDLLRTSRLGVGEQGDGIRAIAESNTPIRYDNNAIAYFSFNLTDISILKNKHYYAFALHSGYMVAYICIDKYIQ